MEVQLGEGGHFIFRVAAGVEVYVYRVGNGNTSLRRFLKDEGWLHFSAKGKLKKQNKEELSKHIFSNGCVVASEISIQYLI